MWAAMLGKARFQQDVMEMVSKALWSLSCSIGDRCTISKADYIDWVIFRELKNNLRGEKCWQSEDDEVAST